MKQKRNHNRARDERRKRARLVRAVFSIPSEFQKNMVVTMTDKAFQSIQAMKQKPRWISVSDSLPKDGWYWTKRKHHGIDIATRDAGTFWGCTLSGKQRYDGWYAYKGWNQQDGFEYTDPVTHWWSARIEEPTP